MKLGVSIGGNKRGSIVLPAISKGMKPAIRKTLRKTGILLEGQIKKNLSGPSHTLFPGNSNPFPGVVSGVLRSSIKHMVVDGGMGVIIGPGRSSSNYSWRHELGVGVKKRPYVKPAWEKHRKQIVENFHKAIVKPARGLR